MNKQERLQAAIADGTHIMILRADKGRGFNRYAEWRTRHEPDGSMLLIADLEDGTSITKRIPAEHVQFFIELVAIDHAMCHAVAEGVARRADDSFRMGANATP